MLNSSHMQRKIEQSPKFQYLMRNSKGGPQLVTALYLTILSRSPTAEESTGGERTMGKPDNLKPREAAIDLPGH